MPDYTAEQVCALLGAVDAAYSTALHGGYRGLGKRSLEKHHQRQRSNDPNTDEGPGHIVFDFQQNKLVDLSDPAVIIDPKMRRLHDLHHQICHLLDCEDSASLDALQAKAKHVKPDTLNKLAGLAIRFYRETLIDYKERRSEATELDSNGAEWVEHRPYQYKVTRENLVGDKVETSVTEDCLLTFEEPQRVDLERRTASAFIESMNAAGRSNELGQLRRSLNDVACLEQIRYAMQNTINERTHRDGSFWNVILAICTFGLCGSFTSRRIDDSKIGALLHIQGEFEKVYLNPDVTIEDKLEIAEHFRERTELGDSPAVKFMTWGTFQYTYSQHVAPAIIKDDRKPDKISYRFSTYNQHGDPMQFTLSDSMVAELKRQKIIEDVTACFPNEAGRSTSKSVAQVDGKPVELTLWLDQYIKEHPGSIPEEQRTVHRPALPEEVRPKAGRTTAETFREHAASTIAVLRHEHGLSAKGPDRRLG